MQSQTQISHWYRYNSFHVFQLVINIFAFTASAFLLFWFEPLIAKALLPYYGGSPMVWLTCTLFYQLVLLGGYLYAHVTTSYLSFRMQLLVHMLLILLVLSYLPMHLDYPSVNLSSIFLSYELLSFLMIYIGPPFFLICTTAPLLQKWFSYSSNPDAHDPYYLYASSNFGSLLALLLFPFAIEPYVGILSQLHYWSIGLAIVFLMILSCGLINLKVGYNVSNRTNDTSIKDVPLSNKLKWVIFSFIPSSLLLGVTNYLTTDIASFPLLWVFPLALYLLTFIIAFSKKPLLSISFTKLFHHLCMVLILIALPFYPISIIHPVFDILLHLIVFFIFSLHCHSILVSIRPHVNYLTQYYLWIAFGGVLGGIFNTLLAPSIFNSYFEYPLTIVLCAFLYDKISFKQFSRKDFFIITIIAFCLLFPYMVLYYFFPIYIEIIKPLYLIVAFIGICLHGQPLRYGILATLILFFGIFAISPLQTNVMYSARNFFGISKVINFPNNHTRAFISGSTIHGMQRTNASDNFIPTYYYPLGMVLWEFIQKQEPLKVGIGGLGIGTIGCYFRSNDQIDFYEINPDVIDIATTPSYFTILKECPATHLYLADARLGIHQREPNFYDIIIMDAFSSDSIPIHLLTAEAITIYLSKLKKTGALLFNITNRHINLKPVLEALAQHHHLHYLTFAFEANHSDHFYEFASQWVCLTSNHELANVLLEKYHWENKTNTLSLNRYLWTDDFSNILSVMKLNDLWS